MEWEFYLSLTDRQQHTEAANWAKDACQHVRMFVAKRTKNLKENLKSKDYSYWLLRFPSELRSRGFKDEAAEINEKMVGLFDDRDLGDFYGARDNFAEAARHYQAAARKSPTDAGIAAHHRATSGRRRSRGLRTGLP